MIDQAVAAGQAGLAVAMAIAMYRVLAGPSLSDRLISLDAVAVNAAAMVVLFGVAQRSPHYLDAALLLAILSFISTVAMAKYLLRRGILERDRR